MKIEYKSRMKMLRGFAVMADLVLLKPLHGLFNRFIKRELDFVFSALVLMFLFPPVLLFVAVMIKKSSSGPIFFTQWRDGLGGQRFKCIKFRSMHADGKTDGRAATKDDPRIIAKTVTNMLLGNKGNAY